MPPLWVLEVANVLKIAEKKKRISLEQSEEFFHLLNALPIQVDESLWLVGKIKIFLGMAREYGLTPYDAAYLELALRHHLPLATLDNDLKMAAKKAGIRLMD